MMIPTVAFALVTVGSLAVAAFMLRRRDWSVLDPTVVFWLGYAVFYGLANLWYCWMVIESGAFYHSGLMFESNSRADLDSLNTVAGLTVLYGVSVAVGMFALGPLLLRTGLGRATRRLASGGDLLLSLIIPPSVLYWMTQIGLIPKLSGNVPSGVLSIPQVCCLALCLKLAYEASSRHSVLRVSIAIGTASVSALAGAMTGMISEGYFALVAAFTGFVLGVRRPWPILAALILALPLFLLGQSWKQIYRPIIWDATTKLSAADRLAVLGGAARAVGDQDQQDGMLGNVDRLCTAIPMLQTLDLVRNNDGISFTDGLLVPYVPRILWPSKPQVLVGGTLYEKFSGREGSSSSPGQPAESFMYGGWPAVVATGTLMGLLAAVASSVVQRLWSARKAAALGVVIFMAINFGKCENWLWTYVPAVLNCVVLLTVLQWVSASAARLRGSEFRTIRRTQDRDPSGIGGLQ